MTKEEINQKYISQANNLETKFFDIVDEGKPSQHRILKADELIEDFNQRHGEIWRNHEAELIAGGFMETPKIPEPVRDAFNELTLLQQRVAKLEEKGIAQRIDALEAKIEKLEVNYG